MKLLEIMFGILFAFFLIIGVLFAPVLVYLICRLTLM